MLCCAVLRCAAVNACFGSESNSEWVQASLPVKALTDHADALQSNAPQGRLLLAARSGRLRRLRIPDASLNVTALLMEQASLAKGDCVRKDRHPPANCCLLVQLTRTAAPFMPPLLTPACCPSHPPAGVRLCDPDRRGSGCASGVAAAHPQWLHSAGGAGPAARQVGAGLSRELRCGERLQLAF